MTEEAIREKLYERLDTELNEFTEKLEASTPKYIMSNAYELVIKNDIVYSFEDDYLTPEQCKALLKTKNPLQKLYDEWLDTEISHMQEIRDVVDTKANKLIKEMKRSKEQSR